MPRQVILGKEDEPYTVLTDLGWSIVGSLAPFIETGMNSLCHCVAVKEIPLLTPMDAIRALESDLKCSTSLKSNRTTATTTISYGGKMET